MVNTVENQLLNLDPQSFDAALAELQLGAEREADLRRQYRRSNSVFAPVYGLLDQVRANDESGGRVRGNVVPMSRPEGMTGLEAMMSGQAEFAAPNSLLGLLEAAPMAADAPMAAYQGAIPMQDMAGEALGVAGAAMGAGGLLSRPAGSVGMGGRVAAPGLLSSPNINALDPNAWRSRIEQSIPRSWLDPKFERPQWHGISGVSSNLPEQDLSPIFRDTGTLVPEQSITIEDLLNRTAIPAYGDRSVAGSDVLGVGSLAYERPFRSLGGADFMREQDTGIWANALDEATELADAARGVINDGGDPALIYTAMGPQSADFSTMMANAVMNQYNPSRMDPRAAASYDDSVRAVLPRFTSIMDPNFLDGLTGSQRWNLWQLMDKAKYRDAGFPNINLARRSITDPRLLNAVPFDAGLTVGRPTGGLLQLDEITQPHPSYPAQLAGSYEGGLSQNIPGQILWRDFFEGRRGSGESVGADQRSFLMNANRMRQTIDQQTVDEANAFMETMRNLEDPSSPLRLWRGRPND